MDILRREIPDLAQPAARLAQLGRLPHVHPAPAVHPVGEDPLALRSEPQIGLEDREDPVLRDAVEELGRDDVHSGEGESPYVAHGRTIAVEKVRLCLLTETTPRLDRDTGLKFKLGETAFNPAKKYTEMGDMLWQEMAYGATLDANKPSETWKLTMSEVPDELKVKEGGNVKVSLDPDKLRNIALICTYKLS